jgi:chromosome segregation ATPase
MTLFHISRKSNANNNPVSNVETPKEKKPSSSLLKLTGNAIKYGYVSYQIHSAKKEVLNATKKFRDADSLHRTAQSQHLNSGAIEQASDKSYDARTKLTSKNSVLTKLTEKKEKIEKRIESIAEKRGEKLQEKQAKKEAETARKNIIKSQREAIDNQIKSLKKQRSQVGSKAPAREEAPAHEDGEDLHIEVASFIN